MLGEKDFIFNLCAKDDYSKSSTLMTEPFQLPNFASYGYQVVKELGHNPQGGRVTYLAGDHKTGHSVVIKQFQFAQASSKWSDYDAYEQEIQLLQQLDHPNIPRYLDSFETPTGFCLVQEYKPAPSLAQGQQFTVDEIKQIAVAVLKVLSYLQTHNPPIIHRDLKPENILVDRQKNLEVYLVDFGFARLGGQDLAVSSVIKGTLGFMPPEQLFNRELTSASDLYSLGITIICLLTQIKSTAVGELIDETYCLNFKPLLPKLNPEFLHWLETMVAPNPKNRYPNAIRALAVLNPLDLKQTTTLTWINWYVKKPVAIIVPIIFIAISSAISTHQSFPTSPVIAQQSVDNQIERLKVTGKCEACDLRGANFSDAHLAGVNLILSDLRGAVFKYATLTKANLGGALLQGANLTGAYLEQSDLGHGDLRGATLLNANLEGANLEEAILSSVDLRSANLQHANFGDAQLNSTNLADANLKNARASNAKMNNAYLKNANLEGAHLQGASLQNADLTGAKLQGAKLDGADLRGARMPDGRIHP